MPGPEDEAPADEEGPDVEEEHADEIAKQGTEQNLGILPRPIW